MEGKPGYVVEITPEAEIYFLQLLQFFYQTHSVRSADQKSNEILNMAMLLDSQPNRGRLEENLSFLGKGHRYLVYPYTSNKSIKIIYFIDETVKKVYITDFFATEMDEGKISGRNK